MLGVGVGLFQTAIRRAGGPSAWTPADLGAGLALWLDADDAATITLNGSNVSQWRDKSGNDWHMGQAVASAQPAYVTGGLNGKPVIRTEGTDFLGNATTSLFRSVGVATWVAVGKYTASLGSGNAMLLFCSNGVNAGLTRLGLTAQPSPGAVLNGANIAAIGSGDDGPWEVIQFAEAQLVGENLWDISMRLRGQQGTDGIMPAVWPEGSLFVLLDGGALQVDLPASARGLARHYRIGPAQRSVDDPSYVERILAFAGVGLRPYAPAHLRARKLGADRIFSWVRRTRIDGDSWEGFDVALGETSENYVLRIVDPMGLRREEVLSAPGFAYSAAMRAADGTLSPYSVEVAQLSDRFGPGPFARIQIDE